MLNVKHQYPIEGYIERRSMYPSKVVLCILRRSFYAYLEGRSKHTSKRSLNILKRCIEKTIAYSFFCIIFVWAVQGYAKIPQQYINNQYNIKIYQQIEKKQYDSAMYCTEKYYRQKSITEKEYYRNIAELSFLLQDYLKAAHAYSWQLANTKNNDDRQQYRLRLIQCYAALSQDSMALYYLRQYLVHSPKIREYLIQSDTLFNNLQHLSWWKELWKEEHYTEADLIYSELQWLDYRKEYEELIYYYQSQPDSLVSLNTNNQYLYAQSLYRLGSLQSAIHELKNIIQKNPNHSQALQLLVTIHKEKQQYKELIATGHQLLNSAPFLYEPYLEIAQALYYLKKYKDSQSYLTFYLQLTSGNENAIWLSVLLAYHRKEYTDVLEQITILINNNYRLNETLLLRAEVYFETDLPQYAIQDILQRIRLQPLTDDLILKYVKRLELLQDTKSCCLLLQSATTSINPDIDLLRKKYCKSKKQ